MSHYQEVDYDRIAKEIGESHLQQRLERQLNLYERQSGWLRKKGRACYRKFILLGLTCTGLLGRAKRQARNPVWVEQEWFFKNLPGAFDGYRILQLTDFHFDFIPELPGIIKEMLAEKSFDLCVLTGDFRGETTGPYEESLADLRNTRDGLGEKVYAVLGNHDNVELMLTMPELNVNLLMNQVVEIERKGEKIQLAGIDDPHYYMTHHFEFLKPDENIFTVLLAHSPECWRESDLAGVDFQMSGHTHGGQICLPGGIPVIAHLDGCPREMIRGRWRAGSLQGYTSRGVGSSSLDLRLNCKPEVTLHTLRRMKK
ncbi:metallophosphoesterase [Kiritimatiellaeota bacterium B1221]|nr:metallophosphoesterase [Kiritimatiellaeota bacterium B1221]